MTVTELRHTGIVVTDMKKALSFYRDLLGLEVEQDFEDNSPYISKLLQLSELDLHMAKLRVKDGGLIELLYFKNHPKTRTEKAAINNIGCTHVAFSVDDLEATYTKLISAGIQFLSAPVTSSDGYAKVAFCQDFDDTFVELVEVL